MVNPYDADQCAAALHLALTMKPDEQRERMRFMRGVVREFNVYRWAGRMLLDAAVMRQRGRFRVTEGRTGPGLIIAATGASRRSTATARGVRAAAAAARAHCALFLDIDGTLLDLAATPDSVTVDLAIAALLPALSYRLGGATALITGRTIADADKLFPGIELPVAGQHGLERRGADGVLHTHGEGPPGYGWLRGELAHLVERHDGLWLEDKGATLALHYRQAPGLASYVHRTVRAGRDVGRGRRRMAAAAGQRHSRNQAGRPRQGRGDTRLHGGNDVCGAPAGVCRRRSNRRIRLLRGHPAGRLGSQGRPRPDPRAIPAARRQRGPALAGCAAAATLNPWSIRMNRSLDLALIGNGAIGLLVDPVGAIVWGCFPRFDGDPVFCALLDVAPPGEERGIWSIEIVDGNAPSSTT